MEDQKQRVYDALNKMGIKYEVVEHEPVHTMEKYLGVKQGSVTPFALMNDTEHAVEFFIDKNLSRCKSMGIHPLENTATVFISFKDLDKFLWNLDVDVVKIKL